MQVGKIMLSASFHGVRSTVHIFKSQYLCGYAATCCNLQVNPSTTHRQCPTPNCRGDTAASAAKPHSTALREHIPPLSSSLVTLFGGVLVTGTCLLKESCWGSAHQDCCRRDWAPVARLELGLTCSLCTCLVTTDWKVPSLQGHSPQKKWGDNLGDTKENLKNASLWPKK